MWLIAMTAPPVRGTFSPPVIVNFRPRVAKTLRAKPMTGQYTGSAMAAR